MSEIKFRGKRWDNRRWIYGNLIKMDSSGSQSFISPFYEGASSLSCGQLTASLMTAVDPATIGQYVGLRDCKRTEEYPEGQEIYVGDIVSWKDDASVLDKTIWGIVEWGEEGFLIHQISEAEMCFYEDTDYRLYMKFYSHDGREFNWKDLEVIGNIHDNPELLTGGAE